MTTLSDRRAGQALAVMSTVPAAAIAVALGAVWPLLALGALRWWSVFIVAVPAALLAGSTAWRLALRNPPSVPAWVLLVVVGVGLASALLAATHHGEHLVLRRDPGAYALTARWIAEHGTRTIPIDWAAFGGHDRALSAASPAYYEDGDFLVPQFLSGAMLLLAGADRVGGLNALFLTPAVVMGLALVAFGGLAVRLMRPGAAALAVTLLGSAYPLQLVARTTYSEPLALLLLMGGLTMLLAAIRSGRVPDALLAGLVLGLGTLIRIDALREVAFLVPVGGWLLAHRRSGGPWLLAGLLLGSAVGGADAVVLARPYAHEVRGSVVPLAVGTVALAVLCLAAAALWRRTHPAGGSATPPPPAAGRLHRWLPVVAATVVGLGGIALALRPLYWLSRQAADSPGGKAVLGFQRVTGLPLDPTRDYSEQTVGWVAWWLGWPALGLALLGAALLTASVCRPGVVVDSEHGAEAGRWAPVLVLLLGSSVLILMRPGITPDHPWADRRLVVVVLPAVALLAAYGAQLTVTRVRAYVPARGGPAVLCACLVAVLFAGPFAALWSLWDVRTERGEVAAVRRACAALHPGDVALLVDNRARREWAQVLRGECGVPTADLHDRTALPDIIAAIQARGGSPVLVAVDHPSRVSYRGGSVEHVVSLLTTQDQRLLVTRPSRASGMGIDLYLGRPARFP